MRRDPHSARTLPPTASSRAMGLEFTQFLQDRGLLDPFAAKRALQAQERMYDRLDLVLTRLGIVAEVDMAQALADYLGLPLLTHTDIPANTPYADTIPRDFLVSNRLVAVRDEADALIVAVADPFNAEPLEALSFLLDKPVRAAIAAPRDIELAIARLHTEPAGSRAAAEAGAPESEAASEADIRRLQDLASDAPVIRLVQDLITRAVESKASDIHIEPREDCLEVRYRIDGRLHRADQIAPSSQAAIASRIKIMARLDIAERRRPQDGRISVPVRGREIDLRVSTMPTLDGESIVMRILDRSSVPLDFRALGFMSPVLEQLEGLLRAPSGIVLVTGPTGSGKTTTLYTALDTLNDRQRKIFTVEDPIEYQISGISQVHVEPKIGLGFASALRSILRQDPDILMVGEIRDLETAQMAVQASLTGHLVLSTVHTNSAAATIARLINMGVEDYLLSSTLSGVIAQRLVRKLCNACSAPATPSVAMLDRLYVDAGSALTGTDLAPGEHRMKRKVGCPACRGSGYAGRISVNELLTVDGAVADAILRRADERSIEASAVGQGMRTMFQDGVVKALLGLTTMDEVLRATRVTS
jgi:general secretion pathway protein E